MTFRRWTSALFACPAKLLLSVVAAATVGLFGQRADASRTPIDTRPAALAPDANGWYRHLTAPCRGAVEYETEQTAANAAGRVTTRTVAGRDYTYSYDAYGRLLSYTDSTDSGNNASYTYDAFGNRVGMTVGSTHRRMVYENEDVIAEYVDLGNDGSVNRSRLYWILPDIDQRIGFVDMEGGATNLYFYLTDHIGSVLQIVDESGAVVNQYDYDAFGNIRWENSFEGVENRYTFQGREWDAHAGHYYFRNRTYVPEWGSFSGPDMNLALGVAGEPNGLMSYLAFGNDPAGKVDPLGLEITSSEGGYLAPGIPAPSGYSPYYHSDSWNPLEQAGVGFANIGSVVNNSLYGAVEGLGAGIDWVNRIPQHASRSPCAPTLDEMAINAAVNLQSSSGLPPVGILALPARGAALTGTALKTGSNLRRFHAGVVRFGDDFARLGRRARQWMRGGNANATAQIEAPAALGDAVIGAKAAKSVPSGQFYSTAFQTELKASSYPGMSRAAHFQEANQALLRSMEADAQFAQSMRNIGINLERTPTGLAPRQSPAGWTWHHAPESGVMELVPRPQHAPGSIFQETLHPGGQGGFSIWGQ